MAMSNITIENFLMKDQFCRKIFKGCIYARGNPDIIANVNDIRAPSMYIVNTDYKSGPGLHWVLVYYKTDHTIFFYSLGLSSSIYSLPFLVEREGLPVLRNTQSIQPLNLSSFYCGHHVVIHALLLARGKTLTQTKTYFTQNQACNDRIASIILKWLQKNLLKSQSTNS